MLIKCLTKRSDLMEGDLLLLLLCTNHFFAGDRLKQTKQPYLKRLSTHPIINKGAVPENCLKDLMSPLYGVCTSSNLRLHDSYFKLCQSRVKMTPKIKHTGYQQPPLYYLCNVQSKHAARRNLHHTVIEDLPPLYLLKAQASFTSVKSTA